MASGSVPDVSRPIAAASARVNATKMRVCAIAAGMDGVPFRMSTRCPSGSHPIALRAPYGPGRLVWLARLAGLALRHTSTAVRSLGRMQDRFLHEPPLSPQDCASYTGYTSQWVRDAINVG